MFVCFTILFTFGIGIEKEKKKANELGEHIINKPYDICGDKHTIYNL